MIKYYFFKYQNLFNFITMCGILYFVISNVSAKVRVGMIDTKINSQNIDLEYLCEGQASIKNFTKGQIANRHSENVYHLITKNMNPNKMCIIIYEVYTSTQTDVEGKESFIRGLKQASKDNLDFLNISMSGEEIYGELKIYSKMLKNTKIIISAGNDDLNLDVNCDVFPACYANQLPELFIIGNLGLFQSNRGKIVDYYIDGIRKGVPKLTGTSQSAAIFTNMLIINYKKRIIRRFLR